MTQPIYLKKKKIITGRPLSFGTATLLLFAVSIILVLRVKRHESLCIKSDSFHSKASILVTESMMLSQKITHFKMYHE